MSRIAAGCMAVVWKRARDRGERQAHGGKTAPAVPAKTRGRGGAFATALARAGVSAEALRRAGWSAGALAKADGIAMNGM